MLFISNLYTNIAQLVTLKSECVRKIYLSSLEQANELMKQYINDYNEKRLHSAIGYITPLDKLNGKEFLIFAEQKNKLKQAQKIDYLYLIKWIV